MLVVHFSVNDQLAKSFFYKAACDREAFYCRLGAICRQGGALESQARWQELRVNLGRVRRASLSTLTAANMPDTRSRRNRSAGRPKIMATRISTRAFVVGCPRSGTTLLQSMLFAHPSIYSFPETHFFKVMFGIGEQVTLGQTPREIMRRLRLLAYKAMEPLGIVDNWRRAKAWGNMRTLPTFDAAAVSKLRTLHQNSEAFVKFVDAASSSADSQIWIEKTPDHLFCIKKIQQYVPDAIFIHLIRNGPDSVASLVDAGRRYPAIWGKDTPLLIELAVRRWNIALRESLKYRGDPRHYLVSYEDLVSEPTKVLIELCNFLGCEFDERMVQNFSEKTGELIREIEAWKKETAGPIRNTKNTKFNKIFNREWQDYILSHIEQF